MKTKIVSCFLLVVMLCFSLSSCLFIDLLDSSGEPEIQNVTVNVDGVNNYDVTINSDAAISELAASKALMSSVSIVAGNASGSGVIFKMSEDKSEAYILTNYHVVYDSQTHSISKNIKAYLYGMESHLYGDKSFDYSMNARYLGGTMEYDLAVLKVTASPVLMGSSARACDFADSNKVTVLEAAMAVGNAAGAGISVTLGRINVDSESISILATDERTTLSLRVMRTDAAVNGGNSGGGLFNASGELIGIVNAKSAGSNTDNIGYAIPSNVAKYIAENIIYYCDGFSGDKYAYKCMLGVNVEIAALYTEYDTESGELVRKETVKVKDIVDQSSAAFGILKSGDVINSIKIDGTVYEVTRMFHVTDAMLNARVGSEVIINVTRGEEKVDLTIPLKASHISKVN